MGSSFNGRTSALHAENKGSIPFGSTTGGTVSIIGLLAAFVHLQNIHRQQDYERELIKKEEERRKNEQK
jgi:hypothetical protein